MQDTSVIALIELFYSYSHKDEELLFRLLEHLETFKNLGLIEGWHDREITAGTDWAGDIDDHLNSAHLILLLVSSSFLASKYCHDVEMKRALERHHVGEARVVPIILRPCLWQEYPFASLQVLPKDGKPVTKWGNRNEAFVNVAKGIKTAAQEVRAAPARPATTSVAPGRVWNVPPRNALFTGREESLSELRTFFQTQSTTVLGQAIRGLGGIGKTQTAIEYAYRFRDEYRHGLWVNAAESATLEEAYREIARLESIPHDSANPDATREAVKNWLEENGDWLLIFDNVVDFSALDSYMPREARGHILVTSRQQALGEVLIGKTVTLRKMPFDEAKTLLLKRTRRSDADEAERQAAEELVRELDGLPLAIAQAGAYIERTQSRVHDYLQSFRTRRLELLEQGEEQHGKRISITTTWSLNFAALDRFPAAKDLLYVSASLAPDAIPFELVIDGAPELGTHISAELADAGEDPLRFIDLLQRLADFSLVDVFHTDSSYSIHRLVQEVVLDSLTPEDRRMWAERVVRATNLALPDVEYQNWPSCERLLPHALSAAEFASKYNLLFAEMSDLLVATASYLQARGQYEEAEPLYQQALEIRRTALGEEHPSFATTLNNLGLLYRDMGRYEEAEPLYRQALEIRRTALGEEHPSFATTLNNLAGLYQDMGRYEEAEPLFRQDLEITRTALREEHPSFAATLNNLGLLYRDMGRYEEAEPLLRQALEIRRTALGEEHASFAISLNNLAGLYRDMGRSDDDDGGTLE